MWENLVHFRAMGPPESLRFRGPGRARAQAGEKISEKSTLGENWDPRKRSFWAIFVQVSQCHFF